MGGPAGCEEQAGEGLVQPTAWGGEQGPGLLHLSPRSSQATACAGTLLDPEGPHREARSLLGSLLGLRPPTESGSFSQTARRSPGGSEDGDRSGLEPGWGVRTAQGWAQASLTRGCCSPAQSPGCQDPGPSRQQLVGEPLGGSAQSRRQALGPRWTVLLTDRASAPAGLGTLPPGWTLDPVSLASLCPRQAFL